MWSLIDQITAFLGIPCLLCSQLHYEPINICKACLADLPWCQKSCYPCDLQSQWLGTELGLPVARQFCRRVDRAAAQQNQKRQERLHNLRHAFQLRQPIQATRIALIDDVLTTGATAEALSRSIRNTQGNKVKQIALWCIARTPPPGHQLIW